MLEFHDNSYLKRLEIILYNSDSLQNSSFGMICKYMNAIHVQSNIIVENLIWHFFEENNSHSSLVIHWKSMAMHLFSASNKTMDVDMELILITVMLIGLISLFGISWWHQVNLRNQSPFFVGPRPTCKPSRSAWLDPFFYCNWGRQHIRYKPIYVLKKIPRLYKSARSMIASWLNCEEAQY